MSKHYSPTFNLKPMRWKSLVNGNEYPKSEYNNASTGMSRSQGMKPLPENEYPFEVIYELYFLPNQSEWSRNWQIKQYEKEMELNNKLDTILRR